MSSQVAITRNEQTSERSATAMSDAMSHARRIKVLIPFDGSQNSEAALNENEESGLARRC